VLAVLPPLVHGLQYFDIEFDQLEYRLHNALRFRGVLIVQHLTENGRYDLPRPSM
jgi:hypothetical protein